MCHIGPQTPLVASRPLPSPEAPPTWGMSQLGGSRATLVRQWSSISAYTLGDTQATHRPTGQVPECSCTLRSFWRPKEAAGGSATTLLDLIFRDGRLAGLLLFPFCHSPLTIGGQHTTGPGLILHLDSHSGSTQRSVLMWGMERPQIKSQ
jgi:hypothetical protein